MACVRSHEMTVTANYFLCNESAAGAYLLNIPRVTSTISFSIYFHRVAIPINSRMMSMIIILTVVLLGFTGV